MRLKQIRTRIMVYFITIAVFICALFAAFSFLFSYFVEDALFTELLQDEKVRAEARLREGLKPEPALDFIRHYPSQASLPESIRTVLLEETERIEFSGVDGKHYHVLAIETGYLVAEVSEQLVVRKIKGGMLQTQLVILGIVTLVVLLMAWSLAKRIIRPIGKLNNILSNARGEALPKGFSDEFADDEIGLFAKQLEQSLARVQAFIEREQHFTRDVSHELRTPVAISQGAVTLLKESGLDKEQHTLVTRIEQAQYHIEQCISGLLSLAREGELACIDLPVLPIVESAIIEHHRLIENKPIEIDINITASFSVYSNQQALKIILNNLISNAFSYTQEGLISIKEKQGQIVISDTGEGIEDSLVSSIFESGVKGSSSEGFGIGLSLTKRLCDRLGIDLNIESDESGTSVALSWRGSTID